MGISPGRQALPFTRRGIKGVGYLRQAVPVRMQLLPRQADHATKAVIAAADQFFPRFADQRERGFQL
ncbi:TPA: YbjN domain-containing protein [Klebsiella aerogenes]|nr:YbjN domain-containing protein [Klebsiella aerogenes]HDU3673021.1 YbjN domain-containing protein [Klebsiella aerogenes]HDU3698415.1 YbjN domain-containing protein [Klebsiella aerogenes]